MRLVPNAPKTCFSALERGFFSPRRLLAEGVLDVDAKAHARILARGFLVDRHRDQVARAGKAARTARKISPGPNTYLDTAMAPRLTPSCQGSVRSYDMLAVVAVRRQRQHGLGQFWAK